MIIKKLIKSKKILIYLLKPTKVYSKCAQELCIGVVKFPQNITMFF